MRITSEVARHSKTASLFIDLAEHECFQGLSIAAQYLYALMVRRVNLSTINGYHDENGEVYIIFGIKEIMKKLQMSERTAIRVLKELENFQLIEKRKIQNGNNLLYINDFAYIIEEYEAIKEEMKMDDDIENQNSYFATAKNDGCKIIKKDGFKADRSENLESSDDANTKFTQNRHFETAKNDGCETAKNDGYSYLDNSYLNNSYNQFINPSKKRNRDREIENSVEDFECLKVKVKYQVNYVQIQEELPEMKEQLNNLINLITDVLLSQKSFTINGTVFSNEMIKRQFESLKKEHIISVLNNMKETNHKIKNMRNYLISSLYNSVLTTAHENMNLQNQEKSLVEHSKNKNRFNNFQQRNYDMRELESLLISK